MPTLKATLKPSRTDPSGEPPTNLTITVPINWKASDLDCANCKYWFYLEAAIYEVFQTSDETIPIVNRNPGNGAFRNAILQTDTDPKEKSAYTDMCANSEFDDETKSEIVASEVVELGTVDYFAWWKFKGTLFGGCLLAGTSTSGGSGSGGSPTTQPSTSPLPVPTDKPKPEEQGSVVPVPEPGWYPKDDAEATKYGYGSRSEMAADRIDFRVSGRFKVKQGKVEATAPVEVKQDPGWRDPSSPVFDALDETFRETYPDYAEQFPAGEPYPPGGERDRPSGGGGR